jgi:hypothetical protein
VKALDLAAGLGMARSGMLDLDAELLEVESEGDLV